MKYIHNEHAYHLALEEVFKCGEPRNDRTGVGTHAIFGLNMQFNLEESFPILTKKKMYLKTMMVELLWMLRGDDNIKFLQDNGVKIWNEWADDDGHVGPMYGYQWRYFNSTYDEKTGTPIEKGIDQLYAVVNEIKTNAFSRRILMTDYNPLQAKDGVLYPCHSISIQFSVDDIYLDMFCFNRSQDVFLGVPYNIASSALLLTVVSSLTNKTPRHLKITMGDTHLYESHINQAQIQMTRVPYAFPKLRVKPLSSLDIVSHLASHDFVLEGYNSHSVIKAEMVV